MEAGQQEAERQGTWKPSLSSKVLKPGTPEGEVGGAAAFLFHFQVQRSAVPAAWERAARNPAQSPFLHPQGPETRVLGIVQVTALPTLPRRVFSLFGVDMHAVCKFSRRVPLPSSVALPPPLPTPVSLQVALWLTDRRTDVPVLLSPARPGCQTSAFLEPMDSLIAYAPQLWPLPGNQTTTPRPTERGSHEFLQMGTM